MNKLYDDSPDTLTIGGREYVINSDWRTWVKFEIKLLKNTDIEFSDIISLIFVDGYPPLELQEETTEQILWFYRCGLPPDSRHSGGSNEQIFDYDYDAGYIYSAFVQQYKINLKESKSHWWEFRWMFLALSPETEFVKIMSYRTIKITSKMPAEQKKHYAQMKKLHKLPLPQSQVEKYNAIEDALINGNAIDDLL